MAESPTSILVVKPSSLGDIVHTLPAVACLKRAWPQASLRWLVNPEWMPLLEGNPDVREAIPFPRRELGGLRRFPRQIQWARLMRREYRADWVLDFQGLLRSALIGRLCRGKLLAGLSDAREGARFFYDRAADLSTKTPLHAVDRYLKLAAAVGADTTGPLLWRLPEGTPPRGFEPGFEPAREEPFVLLHPFSRGTGKSLSAGEVEAFCRALPFPVVLAGRTAVQTARIDALENVTNLLNGTTLGELIWLIRRARFVVSVDSGPMHIAAALTPRLLSIHTWSDPARVGPYNPDAWILKDRTLYQARQMGNPVEKRRTAPDLKAVAAFVEEAIRN